MTIKIYNPNSEPKRLFRSKGPIVVRIGRSRKPEVGNNIIVPDPFVSRGHCFINYDPDKDHPAFLVNTSRKGTYVKRPGEDLMWVEKVESLVNQSIVYLTRPKIIGNNGSVHYQGGYPLEVVLDVDVDFDSGSDKITKADLDESMDRARTLWAAEKDKIYDLANAQSDQVVVFPEGINL